MDTATQAPPAAAPTTPYERLGGRPTITAIADRFYDLMASDPAYAPLRAMHAEDLAPMRESLAGFLTGWSGGPRDWFEANPGRCMMSVHKPLAITADTARQWVEAMRRAIGDVVGESDPQIAKAMGDVLEQMASGMAR
ncbi:group II truncated hemoglobin [Novosphingobium bradum]|uniref:Group II truncated hemoglobin n=1 Tax=Novosphingobium bradum TaxID=1737444 RepID=A0ABV7IWX7_9SPHN